MLRRLVATRLPLGGGVLSTAARAMSRIGKMPVRVPEAVTVRIEPVDLDTLPARKPRTLNRLAGILKRRPTAESLAMFGTPLRVTATGPLGEESVNVHSLLQVTNEEGVLSVTTRCNGTTKLGKTLWGGTRGYLSNAIQGVSRGFRKSLELHGIGAMSTPRPGWPAVLPAWPAGLASRLAGGMRAAQAADCPRRAGAWGSSEAVWR